MAGTMVAQLVDLKADWMVVERAAMTAANWVGLLADQLVA